jgi:predicted small lipoprotein YifL
VTLSYTSAMRVAFVLAILSTATACGQTGSLYLPDEAIETPVEIRTTTDDEKKEGEDKSTEPPGR